MPSKPTRSPDLSKSVPEPDATAANEYTQNKGAFDDFVKRNLDNPRFRNKFVAFVDGRYQGVESKENVLIMQMYDRFGNVHMYVGKVTDQEEIVLIDTPEFN